MAILVWTALARNSAGHLVAPQGLRGVGFAGYPSRIDRHTNVHTCTKFGAFTKKCTIQSHICWTIGQISHQQDKG